MEKLFYVSCAKKGIMWGPYLTYIDATSKMLAFCDIDEKYCLPDDDFKVIEVPIAAKYDVTYLPEEKKSRIAVKPPLPNE